MIRQRKTAVMRSAPRLSSEKFGYTPVLTFMRDSSLMRSSEGFEPPNQTAVISCWSFNVLAEIAG
jgi:hypothetical protein